MSLLACLLPISLSIHGLRYDINQEEFRVEIIQSLWGIYSRALPVATSDEYGKELELVRWKSTINNIIDSWEQIF